jgi:flagellar hook assembly protein FlgD
MTTDEWLAAADTVPEDSVPPEITDLSASQPADTIVPSDTGPVIFTPNGDGLSDTLTIRHTLSEPASLHVEIERVSNGNIVRHMSGWSREGRTRTVWDGGKDSGEMAGDGRYRVRITARDRAGNASQTAVLTTKVLTALKRPKVAPVFFDPSDGDDLGTVTFSARLTRTATISWHILDAAGQLVRTGSLDESLSTGRTTFTWDGRDDAGQPVPRGRYTARVSATTGSGTYAHTTSVLARPFLVTSTRWTLRRGDTARLGITAAEEVDGRPTVTVKQPGLPAWRPRVGKASSTSFSASITARRGGRDGRIRVTISSIDTAGGMQSLTIHLRLR